VEMMTLDIQMVVPFFKGGGWVGLHRMWQRFVLMFQRNVGAGGCCSK